MNFYGKTDVGKKREENQDRFGSSQLDNEMTLLVVCDGMGGANGGETAAELAVKTFISDCKENIKHRGMEQSVKIHTEHPL